MNFWFSALIDDCSVRLSYISVWRFSICPDIPSISAFTASASSLMALSFVLYSLISVLIASACFFNSLIEAVLAVLSFSMSLILSEWSCLLALNVLTCSSNRLISPLNFWLSSSNAEDTWLVCSIVRLSSLSWFSASSYSALVASYSFLEPARSLSAISILLSSSAISFLIRSVSNKNALTSYFFKSDFKLRYSFAFSDCTCNGPTCFSSSDKISLTRTRLFLSLSSFLIAAALRRLNLTIPAASSKSSLRSSGLPLRILSICPCPIIE